MTAEISEPTRCPECSVYYGRHNFDCSLQTVEQKIAWGPHYHDAWFDQIKRGTEYGIRLRKEVALWQGKHAMLRHENNRLRRKLYPKPIKQPPNAIQTPTDL